MGEINIRNSHIVRRFYVFIVFIGTVFAEQKETKIQMYPVKVFILFLYVIYNLCTILGVIIN